MPEIDIHDLKKNTDYNGYRPADKGSFHVSLCARVCLGTIDHYVLTMSFFPILIAQRDWLVLEHTVRSYPE